MGLVALWGLEEFGRRVLQLGLGKAGFSRGQASPDPVHLDHGGGEEVNDGGEEADGEPGIEEEDGQGQAD